MIQIINTCSDFPSIIKKMNLLLLNNQMADYQTKMWINLLNRYEIDIKKYKHEYEQAVKILENNSYDPCIRSRVERIKRKLDQLLNLYYRTDLLLDQQEKPHLKLKVTIS